jgi:hypothetical protein
MTASAHRASDIRIIPGGGKEKKGRRRSGRGKIREVQS